MARSILVLVVLIATACAGRPAAPPAEPAPVIDNAGKPRPPRAASDDPLGLVEGATWTFEGSHTFFDDDRGVDVTADLTVTTVVLGVARRDGQVVVRIEDWPGDVLGDRGAETVITIDDGIAYLGDPRDGDPWVRLPLAAGPGPGCAGDEIEYCWRVEASGTGFDVIYRTRPDLTVYHLEPGRGVTRFEYHHHGTTSDVVLERITD